MDLRDVECLNCEWVGYEKDLIIEEEDCGEEFCPVCGMRGCIADRYFNEEVGEYE